MKSVFLLIFILFAAGITAIVYGMYFACQSLPAGEMCNIAIPQEYNGVGVFLLIMGALVIVFKAVPKYLTSH